MSPRRFGAGRRRAARAILALAAVSACLGAVVAYAATKSGGTSSGLGGNHVVQPPSSSGQQTDGSGSKMGGSGSQDRGRPQKRERQLQPQLLETPPQSTEAGDPQFRFRVAPRTTPAP